MRAIAIEERHGIVLRTNSARDVTWLLRVMPSGPSIHAIGIAQLVAWGTTFYAIPPLLPQIATDLSVSTSSLSVAMTIGLVLNAFSSVAVARWIYRRGARVPMMTGTIAAGCALAFLATSTAGAFAFVALAVLGGAQAALLYEPAFAAVSSQSTDASVRTRAIQVITFWGGWAALWALPTATLLGGWIGWRPTLILFSVLLVGHTLRVHARFPPPAITGADSGVVRGTRISLGLAAAFALGSFVTTAMVVNGILMLEARETTIESASMTFALLAPAQVVSRVCFMRRRGRLARHDGSLPFLLVVGGVTALVAAPHPLAFALFVLLFGSGVGLLTTVRAAIVVSHVPIDDVAHHLGIYSFVTALARAIAPAASSWIFFGIGFELALIVFASMALVAAALVWRGCCYAPATTRSTS